MRILVALGTLILFASLATAQQTRVVHGIGAQTCAGILNTTMANPKTAIFAVTDWVDGYLSGRNMQLALGAQGVRNLEHETDQMTRIFGNCASHPSDFLFIEAIDNYFGTLPVATLSPASVAASGVGAQACVVVLDRLTAEPKQPRQNRTTLTDWVDGYLSGRNMQLALEGKRTLRKLEQEQDQMTSIFDLCASRPADFAFIQAIDVYFGTLPLATLPEAPRTK